MEVSFYPVVFLDAVHYKVREEGRIVTKAACVVLGINAEGRKDILCIWIGENEEVKFWMKVCNELIESFFGKITKQMLRSIRVKSKQKLANLIYQYFDEINKKPTVYHWKYKIFDIVRIKWLLY